MCLLCVPHAQGELNTLNDIRKHPKSNTWQMFFLSVGCFRDFTAFVLACGIYEGKGVKIVDILLDYDWYRTTMNLMTSFV